MDSILTDVRYAMGQLRRIRDAADGPIVADCAERAIDALERVEEACERERVAAEPADLADALPTDQEYASGWTLDEIQRREG